MFPLNKNNKTKNILSLILYCFLVIALFAHFFYCIGKVPPSHYVSKNNILSAVSASANIFNINSNTTLNENISVYEEKLTKFISSAFNERNNSFFIFQFSY